MTSRLLPAALVACLASTAALAMPAHATESPADLAAAATAGSAPVTVRRAEPGGFWRPADLVDYAVVGGAVGLFFGLHAGTPLEGGGIGPAFDPAQPAAILDPRYRADIGRKYLVEDVEETVPAAWVGVAVPVVAAWLTVQEGLATGWDGRTVHDTAVGLGEGLAVTLAATEALKFGFGRLRPDFQDRVRRYYCHRPDHAGVDCAGFAAGPLASDADTVEKVFADGRRSFPSGHAATSFALASYGFWVTGARFVWGPDATPRSRIGGIAAQTVLLGAAGFVAWSRVDDGRHNPSDVLTGAALGTALSSVAWWRRFDSDGRPRRARGPEIGPGPSPLSAAMTLRF